MNRFFDMFTGMIAVFSGIYMLLYAYRIIPRNPKDPERTELMERRFVKIISIIAPIIILSGILLLLGVL